MDETSVRRRLFNIEAIAKEKRQNEENPILPGYLGF